jgi:hypothetical protein
MEIEILEWLQRWYASMTNGDWEHQKGISISTIDNPGWLVVIDLAESQTNCKPFHRIEVERSDTDWLHCWVNQNQFNIACGPTNLSESLEMFRDWQVSNGAVC